MSLLRFMLYAWFRYGWADATRRRIIIYVSFILPLCASLLSAKPIAAQISNVVTFKDVTAAAGIQFSHSHGPRSSLLPEDIGSGAAFADYDNDDDLDLYVVNNPGPLNAKVTQASPGNVLYRNNGDGTFADVTAMAGVGDRGFGMGCVFGDYDNDGDLDLYVTNFGPNVLYRNNADGTFTDVTAKAGVGDARWGTGAAFGDYDNDGDLDLYVPNYLEHDLSRLVEEQKTSMQYGQAVLSRLNPHSFEAQDNVLYRNNGNGTFTDVTAALHVESAGGRSLQAIFTDLDLDGDLDLYVANDLSPNFLYRNNGDGTFTDVSSESWAADFRGSMGLATGDYDGDGDLDLFMSHWIDQENALYSNLLKEEGAIEGASAGRPIHLVDESYGASLGEESLNYVGWGTDFFDYDNDGDLDIFVANGHTFQYLDQPEQLIAQNDQLFRYDGEGIFTDATTLAGVDKLPVRVGRGVTFGDYDNDGDVDLFIVNNHDRAVLLRNEGGNRNNWLHVKLIGTKGNRDGVGAKIRLKAGDLIQLREIAAGSSFLSSNSLVAEFGLGRQTAVDWVEVTWLGGKTERFSDIQSNRRIVLMEGKGIEPKKE
ncbi:MAG: CRTAC1 family protein [Candidatus Poribacteria bacterium]|nr:CRTAC1 family protein [Candidatus Poribacteria bacterium]